MDQDQTNQPAETPIHIVDGNHLEPPRPEPKFSKKRVAIVLVGIIILGGAGFGLALLQEKPPAATTNTTQTSGVTQEPTTQLPSDSPAASGSKEYKADFPRVEFTYPDNWTVTANAQQEGIRIESPQFNYQSINGNSVAGNFRIYIRQGARQQDSNFIGRGVASKPTEKLAYTSPLANQRAETNLSFFGIDDSSNFAYFLIAGNFTLAVGDSLGPDYGKEEETYIIAGGYSSNELTEDLATNPVPLSYFDTTNAYQQAIDILKSLKLY